MRNTNEKSRTGVNRAGILTNDARKALKPIYYVDQVEASGDNVAVDYTLNDNWLFINLSFSELKQFALNRSLNDYCFDYMHGEHVQDAGSFDLDTFMAENLEAVIKAYLEAYPLETVNVQLEALKAKISKSTKLSTVNA